MPGRHGNKEEKDMREEKDKDMEINNPDTPDKMRKDEEKYAVEDMYSTKALAEKRAKEMGGEGSHQHVHMVDDKELVLYMPFDSHEEYLKAKEDMEKDNRKDDKEKEMGAHDKDKEEDMGKHEDDEKDMGKHKDDEKDMEDDDDEKKMSNQQCDCDENKEICDDSCKPAIANHSIEQTFNINGVEIFSTGIWNGDKYTKKDLNAMVKNFDETGFQPPLKLGHNEEQPEMKDGEPALGYVDKIYTTGNKLLADFKELPKKVYEAIKRGNYKRVSSEIYWNYKNNGSVLDRVLKAVALLGSEIPAVTNLEAIEGLYAKDNGSGEVKRHYTEKESELMEKDISKEYQELQDKVKALEEANQKAYSELEETRKAQKQDRINKFISDQKESGKVLPVFEKELEALLSSATESKVYSYTIEENTVELSQLELVEKIFSSLPEIVSFAEISTDGEFVVDRQPYTNAGDEVDRRANLYMSKGKAKDYSEAIELVFKEDSELKEDYYKQQ